MKMKLSCLVVSASAFVNAAYATVNITELLADTPQCAVSKVDSLMIQVKCKAEIFTIAFMRCLGDHEVQLLPRHVRYLFVSERTYAIRTVNLRADFMSIPGSSP